MKSEKFDREKSLKFRCQQCHVVSSARTLAFSTNFSDVVILEDYIIGCEKGRQRRFVFKLDWRENVEKKRARKSIPSTANFSRRGKYISSSSIHFVAVFFCSSRHKIKGRENVTWSIEERKMNNLGRQLYAENGTKFLTSWATWMRIKKICSELKIDRIGCCSSNEMWKYKYHAEH